MSVNKIEFPKSFSIPERFKGSFEGKKHYPVFYKTNLNLSDFATAEIQMKESQDVLLTLYHILEDCDLSAPQLVKIAKAIKFWRKVRRYYKCLWIIGERMTGDPKDLQRLMGKTDNFLNKNKEMSMQCLEEIKDIL